MTSIDGGTPGNGPRLTRVAFLIPDLRGGGAERVLLQLAGGFAERGLAVDLVVRAAQGELLEQVPKGVRLVDLATGRMATAVLSLRRYVRREAPIAIVSALTHTNLIALAALITRRRTMTPVVVTEHSHISLRHAETRAGRAFILPALMRMLYPRATAVVAVSSGVADDIRRHVRGGAVKVTVIPNPVSQDQLRKLSRSRTESHPWLSDDGPPVILSVGRLSKDKDQATLIRAFALAQRKIACRLLILGDGDDRPQLERLADELGVSDSVSMPGFSQNPYPYFAQAGVFALSSIHEGLPTALLEAVALGVPSVSTDCQSGPREILDDGRHGRLVPPGDAVALADALVTSLQRPLVPAPDALDRYRMESVLDQYASLIGL